MCFSSNLSELFSKTGVSQQFLADEITQKTGYCIHQTSLGNWLRGDRSPLLEAAVAIATYFNVSLDYLAGKVRPDEQLIVRIGSLTDAQRQAVVAMTDHFEKVNADSKVTQPIIAEDSEDSEDSEEAQGYVYFVHSPESARVKIGYTTDPDKRIHTLQTASPSALEPLAIITGTVADERELHRRFAHLRAHREWFTDCDELREYIATLE